MTQVLENRYFHPTPIRPHTFQDFAQMYLERAGPLLSRSAQSAIGCWPGPESSEVVHWDRSRARRLRRGGGKG